MNFLRNRKSGTALAQEPAANAVPALPTDGTGGPAAQRAA